MKKTKSPKGAITFDLTEEIKAIRAADARYSELARQSRVGTSIVNAAMRAREIAHRIIAATRLVETSTGEDLRFARSRLHMAINCAPTFNPLYPVDSMYVIDAFRAAKAAAPGVWAWNDPINGAFWFGRWCWCSEKFCSCEK